MRYRLILTILTVGLLLNVPLISAEPSTGPALEIDLQEVERLDHIEYVPGELLVKFADGTSRAAMENARHGIGAQHVKTFSSSGIQHWRLDRRISVIQALDQLSIPPFRSVIEYVEPNYIYRASDVPNDSLRNELWGLHNIGQLGGTKDADIDALEAWAVQTGSSTIVVGDIDSGIDYNHEDLSANIWTNPGEIPDNEIDDDNNGFVDDVRGWDFVNDDNDPMDDNGHGTHTAGTIGAEGNNGIGVVGVNWDVQIMPIKFLNSGGWGSNDAAIAAINYAASFEDESGNKIVRITSNSWGGGRKSKALEAAIANSGALFVAAAGNTGWKTKNYPAGYPLDNIISVAATDRNDNLAGFSSYGTDWVDLAAPGVGILSTYHDDEYKYIRMDGTSMSAPHVAGAAALIMADDPSLSNSEVKAAILDNVDPLPSLDGKVLTGGRLNVRASLGAPELPPDSDPPSAVSDLASIGQTMLSITLGWTATGDDGDVGTAYMYDLRYHSETITEENWDATTKVDYEPIPQPSGSTETFEVTGLSIETTYYFALKAIDEAGNPSSLSNVASVTTDPSAWDIDVVDSGEDIGNYISLAYDPLGNPALGYTDDGNDRIKFAHWNGASWDIEDVDEGFQVHLAYDPTDGYPSLTYGDGDLRFAHWNGASWDIEVVVEKGGTSHSFAYDPNTNVPTMSFVQKEGKGKWAVKALKFARYNPGSQSWDIEVVDDLNSPSYNSLAYDLDGNPAIAYSGTLTGEWRDMLKYAHWNGDSWDIEIIESDVRGVGSTPTLDFNPITGYPSVSHTFCGGVRFSSWNGDSWDTEVFYEVRACPRSAFSYSPDGIPFVSFIFGKHQYVAWKIGDEWEYEIADDGPGGSYRFSLKFNPSGNPAMSYVNGKDVKYAVRP